MASPPCAPGWEHLTAQPPPCLSSAGVALETVKTVYLDDGASGAYLVETWDGDSQHLYTAGLVQGVLLTDIVSALARPGRRVRVQKLPLE